MAPECWHCYAEAGSKRNPAVLGYWGRNAPRVIGAAGYWDYPRKWNDAARRDGVRRRVFMASLADVFEDREDLVDPRARAFEVIDRCDWLDFLVLTKRPNLVSRLWPGGEDVHRPNVWLGTSCGCPSSLWRVQALREHVALAGLLFVSAEPLLAPLDFGWLLDGIGWVIVGGESGPRDKARPFDPDWARWIAKQCERAGSAFYMKQLGSVVVNGPDPCPPPVDPKGGDPEEWPEDLRVREMPEIASAG